MRRTIATIFLAICWLGLAAYLLQAHRALAIPAFARKYQMSCTTCHAPVPRLKAYGDEFAGNGFVLKDKDAPRYVVKTGDERLALIRDFPIAARMEGFVKHETVTGKEVDLSVPYNLKLLSGGSLGFDIAYYFYFYMSERGEVAGVEDAYLMFNDLLGQDFDIYVGQFQISDPLFKREVRLTYEDYKIYTTRPWRSNINLAYDRGFMLTLGLPSGTDLIGQVLNGNGISEALPDRTFDSDKYKSLAGRISQDVGEHLRLGAFGYYGKERASAFTNAGTASLAHAHADNRAWLAGGDATIGFGPVELNLQYLERRDDNPGFLEPGLVGDEAETRGGMAELIIWPHGDQSKWYAVALYNKVESDVGDAVYETITAHAGHVFLTNLRFIVEDTYDIENEENRFVVGFVAGF